jgi:hypothetical protein
MTLPSLAKLGDRITLTVVPTLVVLPTAVITPSGVTLLPLTILPVYGENVSPCPELSRVLLACAAEQRTNTVSDQWSRFLGWSAV